MVTSQEGNVYMEPQVIEILDHDNIDLILNSQKWIHTNKTK